MSVSTALDAKVLRPTGNSPRELPPLLVYWTLFAGSIVAFIMEFLLADTVPVLRFVLQIMSSVTCGLAWLLSRELFRGERQMGRWPPAIVAALFTLGLMFLFLEQNPKQSGFLIGALDNLYSMLTSTILLFIILEPIDGLSKQDSADEKRLRILFVAGLSVLLLLCVAWFTRASELPGLQAFVKPSQVLCASIALLGFGFVVRYRLSQRSVVPESMPRPAASLELTRIANQIVTLFENQHIYRNPSLKVADLSQLLKHPEYKITQAITKVMTFPNFNRMINFYRIEDAKGRLSDPSMLDLSILAIALDSGFGSIGPFNRSFKMLVGVTPSTFRAQLAQANS